MSFTNAVDHNNRGKLYVVATPLGNLEDITLRAKSVLASASWIACEDTRHSGKLLSLLGIKNRLISLHAHNENEAGVIEKFIQRLEMGETGALISDAGTPLMSDPGLPLVKMAQSKGIDVIPVPGACAAIAALSAMGLACARFSFEGFLPVKSIARQKILQKLKEEGQTLIFYEAPHRIKAVLAEMAEIFGYHRQAGIGRELTKKFEQIVVGSLGLLSEKVIHQQIPEMGEFVVVIEEEQKKKIEAENENTKVEISQAVVLTVDKILKTFLVTMPVKEAAKLARDLTGLNKNVLYERALQLNQN